MNLQNFPRSYNSNAKVYLIVPGRGNVTMEGVVMCDGVIGYERTSFMETAYSQVRNATIATSVGSSSARNRLTPATHGSEIRTIQTYFPRHRSKMRTAERSLTCAEGLHQARASSARVTFYHHLRPHC